MASADGGLACGAGDRKVGKQGARYRRTLATDGALLELEATGGQTSWRQRYKLRTSSS